MGKSTKMLKNKGEQQNNEGKYLITVYYVTNDTKSITCSVTSNLKHGNNFLLVHRPNTKANVVENKLICDSCTMPTPYPIFDECVVKQTKSTVGTVTTAPLLTIRTAFPALSTGVQSLVIGS